MAAVSQFTTPLELTPVPALGVWVTARALKFDVGFLGSGVTIIVPEGFETDLASVPGWLWWLFPRDDPQYAAAAVLHDWLYRWKHPASFEKFDRRTADAIFLEAMVVLGVDFWRAFAMFVGVRIFGRGPWESEA